MSLSFILFLIALLITAVGFFVPSRYIPLVALVLIATAELLRGK